jgi:enolase
VCQQCAEHGSKALGITKLLITKAGYEPSTDISICLDPAASEMWDDGKYVLFKSTKKAITSDGRIRLWECSAKQYPIVLLEDGG